MLLLVERQPILQWPKVGVVLQPDCKILTEVTRKAGTRGEVRSTVLSKPEVNNRVDDEFVIVLALTDDGADLHIPLGFGELRHRIKTAYGV